MPRPNPHRSIASEQSLARRIAYEREKRGMSYDGLASRMTAVGCAIQGSALFKIEKSDPPRRITVDELVALSRVFGITIQALIQPPEEALNRELLRLIEQMAAAIDQTLAANMAYKQSLRGVAEFVIAHPETIEQIDQLAGTSIQGLVETLRDVDDEEDQRLADRLERLSSGKHQEA